MAPKVRLKADQACMSFLVGPADITCMLGIRSLNDCSEKQTEVHQVVIHESGNVCSKEGHVGSGWGGDKNIECFSCHRNKDECV